MSSGVPQFLAVHNAFAQQRGAERHRTKAKRRAQNYRHELTELVDVL